MKVIEFNEGNEEAKNTVIDSFKSARCFIAVSIEDGKYLVHHYGMTKEQMIYACELVKRNFFDGVFNE